MAWAKAGGATVRGLGCGSVPARYSPSAIRSRPLKTQVWMQRLCISIPDSVPLPGAARGDVPLSSTLFSVTQLLATGAAQPAAPWTEWVQIPICSNKLFEPFLPAVPLHFASHLILLQGQIIRLYEAIPSSLLKSMALLVTNLSAYSAQPHPPLT